MRWMSRRDKHILKCYWLNAILWQAFALLQDLADWVRTFQHGVGCHVKKFDFFLVGIWNLKWSLKKYAKDSILICGKEYFVK